MNRNLLFNLSLLLITTHVLAQQYPFQNTRLSDDQRLDNLLSLMTLEEKIDNLSSRPAGIARLGVKGTVITEGLHGVAYSGPANWSVQGEGESPTTVFPQAYGLAQTWDPELIQELAAWEGLETRYLAQHPDYGKKGLIMLAPNADLGRDIRWGRTEECYGEDAYLAGELTTAFVKGLQGNHPDYWQTASLMKHFLANSNENERTMNSSDFDERLFHEYYSYPFFKGVTEGGSRAYMAAYNKVNGIPATVHPMLREITVDQWGQNGIICTDGGAFQLLLSGHDYYPDLETAAAACIKAGINMFLDRYKEPLMGAIDKGMVTEKEIDTVLKGTLRVLLKLGLMDNSDKNPYRQIGLDGQPAPWTREEAKELARKVTSSSVVLLKNKGLLPIQSEKIKSIAVIGPSANQVISDWYTGTPPYAVSILDGIQQAVGDQVKIHFTASNKADSAVIAAKQADVAIVCIGNHPLSYGLGWAQNHVYSDGREAVDRQAITLEQEDLIKLVKAANPNTVLVLVSSFPYAINWSKENIGSILHVTQSSQELGNGLADVLFGKISPAGRLVQTWTSSIDQLPPILDYNLRNGRTYMYDQHEPLWPFGHGLSYTSFEYLTLNTPKTLKSGQIHPVEVTIKNNSAIASDEVVQLYVRYPNSSIDRPMKSLKSFQRIPIASGETKTVILKLDPKELKHWNIEKQQWELEKTTIELLVGASSADIRLQQTIEIK